MKKNQLEIACFNYESALIAQDNGADRIELCENMHLGGTTPNYVLTVKVREKLSIKMHVIIRPRGGDFFYNDEEIVEMKQDLKQFKKLGVDGFVFGILNENGSVNKFGKKIKEGIELNNKTAVGVAAPQFSQTDVNGKVVKLSDYKGKYVLVDFWASWCGPCRKENPNVVLAYKTYHDKGFDVLGVSLDDKKKLWEKAIEKDGLTWTHVSDLKGWKNEAAVLYGVKLVPTNYLIGPDGKIVAKNLREAELQSKLKEIFSKS